MKINEIITKEGWFSKKENPKSEKQSITDFADTIIERYKNKYSSQHILVPFDNNTGDSLRDVIARGIIQYKILPNIDESTIKEYVDNLITNNYINFKINNQIDDIYSKKYFRQG